MKDRKKPAIRFKGFTEDWEQCKAVDIAEYSKGNGYSKGDLTEIGTPIILYGRLYTKYQFSISEVDTFATPKDGSVYSKGNEVIIPASGETAEDIARASAVEKTGVLLGGDLNVLRPFSFINPLFLALTFSSGEPQKELAKKAQGKSVVHIHNSDIQEVSVSFPTRTEQDSIVTMFRNLDHLITLHQRKYDKLVNIKKSMLEKMFPCDGKIVPDIRFSGFTEDWEQRKLGNEVIEILAGGDINKNKIVENGKYPIYANALTNGGIVGYYDDYYRVKAPAVTVTGRGEVGFAKARMTDFTPVVRLLAIRSNHDCYFLENAINNHKVVVESTGVPQLTVPQLSSYSIFFPKNIEEETRIGEYFYNLDNLITLHQRKLEKLKNIKKSCLEKMFI
nr:restriction endonuclease subunit S [uncultured Peptostreptococcus sp.]